MESHIAVTPQIAGFIEELLGSGETLAGIAGNLISGLVKNGNPEPEATADILEMIAGTIAARLSAVPEGDVVRATELIVLSREAVMTDLERALALARRHERRARRTARRRR